MTLHEMWFTRYQPWVVTGFKKTKEITLTPLPTPCGKFDPKKYPQEFFFFSLFGGSNLYRHPVVCDENGTAYL